MHGVRPRLPLHIRLRHSHSELLKVNDRLE